MDEETSVQVHETLDQEMSDVTEVIEEGLEDSRWNVMSGEDPVDCYSPVVHMASCLQHPDNQEPESMADRGPDDRDDDVMQIETDANVVAQSFPADKSVDAGPRRNITNKPPILLEVSASSNPNPETFYHIYQASETLPHDLRRRILEVRDAATKLDSAIQKYNGEISDRLRRLERSMFYELIASPAWKDKGRCEMRKESARRLTRSLVRADQKMTSTIQYFFPFNTTDQNSARNIMAPLVPHHKYPVWFLLGRQMMHLKAVLNFQNRVTGGPPGTASSEKKENYSHSVTLAAMKWQYQILGEWIKDMDRTRKATITRSKMRWRIFCEGDSTVRCDTWNMTAATVLRN